MLVGCGVRGQLAHPIVSALAGTAQEWAREALGAAAAGDVLRYERAAPPLPDLRRAHAAIRTKIALLCLIQVPRRPTFSILILLVFLSI